MYLNTVEEKYIWRHLLKRGKEVIRAWAKQETELLQGPVEIYSQEQGGVSGWNIPTQKNTRDRGIPVKPTWQDFCWRQVNKGWG